jgi:hypothetical protein
MSSDRTASSGEYIQRMSHFKRSKRDSVAFLLLPTQIQSLPRDVSRGVHRPRLTVKRIPNAARCVFCDENGVDCCLTWVKVEAGSAPGTVQLVTDLCALCAMGKVPRCAWQFGRRVAFSPGVCQDFLVRCSTLAPVATGSGSHSVPGSSTQPTAADDVQGTDTGPFDSPEVARSRMPIATWSPTFQDTPSAWNTSEEGSREVLSTPYPPLLEKRSQFDEKMREESTPAPPPRPTRPVPAA